MEYQNLLNKILIINKKLKNVKSSSLSPGWPYTKTQTQTMATQPTQSMTAGLPVRLSMWHAKQGPAAMASGVQGNPRSGLDDFKQFITVTLAIKAISCRSSRWQMLNREGQSCRHSTPAADVAGRCRCWHVACEHCHQIRWWVACRNPEEAQIRSRWQTLALSPVWLLPDVHLQHSVTGVMGWKSY